MGIDEHSCFKKIALRPFKNTNDHEVPRIFINKNIFMSFLLGTPLDLHYLCRLDKQTMF